LIFMEIEKLLIITQNHVSDHVSDFPNLCCGLNV
jgi:hypothetical protein